MDTERIVKALRVDCAQYTTETCCDCLAYDWCINNKSLDADAADLIEKLAAEVDEAKAKFDTMRGHIVRFRDELENRMHEAANRGW